MPVVRAAVHPTVGEYHYMEHLRQARQTGPSDERHSFRQPKLIQRQVSCEALLDALIGPASCVQLIQQRGNLGGMQLGHVVREPVLAEAPRHIESRRRTLQPFAQRYALAVTIATIIVGFGSGILGCQSLGEASTEKLRENPVWIGWAPVQAMSEISCSPNGSTVALRRRSRSSLGTAASVGRKSTATCGGSGLPSPRRQRFSAPSARISSSLPATETLGRHRHAHSRNAERQQDLTGPGRRNRQTWTRRYKWFAPQ